MPTDRSIYRSWVQHNFKRNAQISNYFCIGAMVICAAFDPLFFSVAQTYTPWRVIPIGVSVLCLVVLRLSHERHRIPVFTQVLLQSSAAYSGCLLYLYYLQSAPAEDLPIVFVGNLLVALFAILSVNRMSLANLTLWTFSLTSSLAWGFLASARNKEFFLVSISYAVMAALSFLWRKDFKHDLRTRLETLKMMLPRREAELMAVINSPEAWDQVFQPKNRFSVCLCADWRGYQKMAREMKPEEMSYLFNLFYQPALDLLEKIDPTGSYYANWVADEFFIIFYDENDDQQAVLNRAVAFARAFTGAHFRAIKPLFPFSLQYDVGMAAGTGLLGMQGPRGMKRTTLTAEHAGIAKRLQTEAKRLRDQNSTSDHPVIMTDEKVAEAFRSLGAANPQVVTVESDDLVQAAKYYRLA